jgi:hypothetical protein
MTGKGLHGRQLAEQMLAVPVLLVLILAFLIVTGPRFIGPMFVDGQRNHDWVTLLGVAGFVVGFLWMIRIYRSTLDAEARPSSWRSRSR